MLQYQRSKSYTFEYKEETKINTFNFQISKESVKNETLEIITKGCKIAVGIMFGS